MDTDKKVFQYIFFAFFAIFTGYTLLLRSSLYNEKGLPQNQNSIVRVVGENLAGDYGLFQLLEKRTPTNEAYHYKAVSEYLKNNAEIGGRFVSFASPMKSFAVVPWLALPYTQFFDTWWIWGIILFGISLYTIFSLSQTLLLMISLPVAFLSFTLGGWGFYTAAGVMLALTLSLSRPKTAGVFAGLLIVEPSCFVLTMALLIWRRQKKTVVFGGGLAAFLVAAAGMRYGTDAFGAAWGRAWTELSDYPCVFSSLYAVMRCGKYGAVTAGLFQAGLIAALIYGAAKMLKAPNCCWAVQNAYLCAMMCLILPFTVLSDFALCYAGVAFLIKDSENHGLLKGDLWFFFAAFASIYVENLCMETTGAPFQMVIALGLAFSAYRRRL